MNIYDYLGRPWERGKFDCWHFVREFYRRELHIDLPVIAIDAENFKAVVREFAGSPAWAHFAPIDAPGDYDLVFMFHQDNKRVAHVGVYLTEFGMVLHNSHGNGVISEPLERLRTRGMVAGYYRHRERGPVNV